MKSLFIKEQRRYGTNELSAMLGQKEANSIDVIRNLKSLGVLKVVRASSSQRDISQIPEDDIIVADMDFQHNQVSYVFTFVGILIVNGCILKCYPKYIETDPEPVEEFKQILKVLEREKSKTKFTNSFDPFSVAEFSDTLSAIIFLLRDFF